LVETEDSRLNIPHQLYNVGVESSRIKLCFGLIEAVKKIRAERSHELIFSGAHSPEMLANID
jgi:hypothetical protein